MQNLTEAQLRGLSILLEQIAEDLDVPPSKYEDAKRSYDAVGDWLNRPESELAQYSPRIYPQGSFALGTAVKPEGDDHYDVDAVCVLDLAGPARDHPAGAQGDDRPQVEGALHLRPAPRPQGRKASVLDAEVCGRLTVPPRHPSGCAG